MVATKLDVGFPASVSVTVNPAREIVYASLSLIVEVADAVLSVIGWELVLVIVIAPVKVSVGSAIRSPITATGMLTEVDPAGIV